MNALYSTKDTIEFKKNIVDFIEGRMEAKVFEEYFQANPQILDWLQSMVPDGMTDRVGVEVKLDYFLKKLPEEKYRQIMNAYETFYVAKAEPLDTQLGLAKILVDLLDEVKDEAEFESIIALLVYNYKTVLANPSKYKPHYIQEFPDFIRELFEKNYTTVMSLPYDVKRVLPGLRRSSSTLWYYVNLQSWLYHLMGSFFPDEAITEDETLYNKASFLRDVCPEYIDGPEVESSGIIERIVAEVPENMPKKERIKQIKNKIKQAFHIEGAKYPRWIQGAEWPISASGKPMRFVEQKREKGKLYQSTLYTHFIFEDVDTGEIKVIDQFT